MVAEADVASQVRADLNFATDRTNNGIWSNANPELTTQSLTAQPVVVRDARSLPKPPSIAVEGFAIAPDPLGQPRWTDEQWVLETYLPQCLRALCAATGASRAVPIHHGVILRDTGNAQAIPAAEFVHIDRDRESSARLVERALEDEAVKTFRRAMIVNVWRAISPPPQDVPLAVCDQRSVNAADWVYGKTVEPTQPDGVPYVTSVFDPGQQWYYVSDMTADEVLVFKNYDSDDGAPLGCLHGAFKLPGVGPDAVPRASVEARLLAIFD